MATCHVMSYDKQGCDYGSNALGEDSYIFLYCTGFYLLAFAYVDEVLTFIKENAE